MCHEINSSWFVLGIHMKKLKILLTDSICAFQNYTKKTVMELALPVAVRFLQHENRELSRNMSSYLSLAAIDNAQLLAQQIHLIIDSVVNHSESESATVGLKQRNLIVIKDRVCNLWEGMNVQQIY